MLELPTGNSDKGLGNGRAWWTFPIWVQKSFGPWTTYGGGGRAFNSAPGMRDYNFGGWLLQRSITKKLILGGEVFAQGAATVDGRHSAFLNFGGYYNDIEVCGGCNLLFRAGHTVAGESQSGAYLGLYWSWPTDRTAEKGKSATHERRPGLTEESGSFLIRLTCVIMRRISAPDSSHCRSMAGPEQRRVPPLAPGPNSVYKTGRRSDPIANEETL